MLWPQLVSSAAWAIRCRGSTPSSVPASSAWGHRSWMKLDLVASAVGGAWCCEAAARLRTLRCVARVVPAAALRCRRPGRWRLRATGARRHRCARLHCRRRPDRRPHPRPWPAPLTPIFCNCLTSMSARPEAFALGELHRQLIVGHALVHLLLVAAEHRVLAHGIAHALQHHAREHGFELLGDRADGLRIIRAGRALQLAQTREVCVSRRVRFEMSELMRVPIRSRSARRAGRRLVSELRESRRGRSDRHPPG